MPTANPYAAGASGTLQPRSDIDRGLAALRSEEVVVYPTETFYGLGVDAFSTKALERLFRLKAREADKAVGVIVHDQASAFALASEVTPQARLLAERFWPGPLTLVLRARPGLPKPLVGPEGGVAVRVSSHPVARALAEALGRPITATSANPAGSHPAREISEASAYFGTHVAVYLGDGRLSAQNPSTLVRSDEHGVVIMRPGAIAEREIAQTLSRQAL